MIPHLYVSLVLTLAVYRLCRLIGWDEFPPIARLRDWVTGAEEVVAQSINQRLGVTNDPPAQTTWRYKRPLLARFIECPFCLGWWLSLGAYLAWLWEPRYTLYALFPFALSGLVGLTSKNLDA